MNLVGLSALVLIVLPFAASAQRPLSSSVCSRPDKDSERAVLTICTHERGMTALPQPRLFLRLFVDGRGEYERNAKNMTLEKKELRVTPEEVFEIQCLGRESDFQAADAAYPAHHRGTDSSRETTVIFRDAGRQKKIVLQNYWAGLDDNVEHYPSSFNALMLRATWMWERAMGIHNPPPYVSFCEMVKNRKTYIGNERRLGFFAILEHYRLTTRDGKRSTVVEYFKDPECQTETKGAPDGIERVGVGYKGEEAAAASLRAKVEKIEDKPFYGRARVFVLGKLRAHRNPAEHSLDHYFEIDEIKTMDPVVLPFKGLLENGWTYSDTFDHKGGDRIELSQDLRGPIHHAVSMEWRNLAQFPRLLKPGRKYITFRVTSVTSQMIKKYHWNSTYSCEILTVGR